MWKKKNYYHSDVFSPFLGTAGIPDVPCKQRFVSYRFFLTNFESRIQAVRDFFRDVIWKIEATEVKLSYKWMYGLRSAL